MGGELHAHILFPFSQYLILVNEAFNESSIIQMVVAR